MSEVPRKDPKVTEGTTFGDRLRMLRNREGWTQSQMARKLDPFGFYYSDSAVGSWENSGRRPPMEVVNAMADLFNVDVNFLLGKTNKTTMLLTESDSPYTACATITDEESMVLEYIRRLSARQRQILRRFIQDPVIHPEMWQLLEQEMNAMGYPRCKPVQRTQLKSANSSRKSKPKIKAK